MKQENINKILLIVFGIIVGVITTLILVPTKIAKLSDGSEEVASISTRTISADEYYNLLKKKDNLSVLLREIDVSILKGLYPDSDNNALAYAENRYSTFLEQSELYGMSEEESLKQMGYTKKDEFINYLKDDYYLNKYYESKLTEVYTEDDYKSFYDNNYFPTKGIYIFSDSTNKNKLKEIKNKLDKGTKVSKILSTYTDIPYNQIDINFTDFQYGEDVLNIVKLLGINKTSSIVENEVFGNYFVYVYDAKENQSYDDVRSSIEDYFMNKAEQDDPNVMYKIMIDLQKEYKLEFKDDELKEAYNKYIAEHK